MPRAVSVRSPTTSVSVRSITALLLTAALAGCTPSAPGPVPDAVPATPTASADPAATTPPAPPVAVDAATVRADGVPVETGDLTVAVVASQTAPTIAVADDGSNRFTVTVPAGTPAPQVATEQGTTAEVLGDGSVVLRDAEATPVGGLSRPVATADDGSDVPVRYESADPEVLRLVLETPDGRPAPAVTLSSRLVASTIADATWGNQEGGRSLSVYPEQWLRNGSIAAQEVGWAQLVALVPEADTTVMHNQLLCHILGAPEKESWNLEPWRPDVGYLETLIAACNPE